MLNIFIFKFLFDIMYLDGRVDNMIKLVNVTTYLVCLKK